MNYQTLQKQGIDLEVVYGKFEALVDQAATHVSWP